MKTQFDHDGQIFKFERNRFTGLYRFIIDKDSFIIDSPWNPLTHFWLTLKREKQFIVQGETLTIIHKRPFLFSFAKPHEYLFLINGVLIHKYIG